jgi:hypothetical protein
LFRVAKATLDTRPIFHSSDAAIRGHVFCSFLALVLAKELKDRCAALGLKPEWDRLIRDLDRLQSGDIERDGRTITVRTPVAHDRCRGSGMPANRNPEAPPRSQARCRSGSLKGLDPQRIDLSWLTVPESRGEDLVCRNKPCTGMAPRSTRSRQQRWTARSRASPVGPRSARKSGHCLRSSASAVGAEISRRPLPKSLPAPSFIAVPLRPSLFRHGWLPQAVREIGDVGVGIHGQDADPTNSPAGTPAGLAAGVAAETFGELP